MSADSDRAESAPLSERLAARGWPLFVLALVVLAVVFGWMFLTVELAGS